MHIHTCLGGNLNTVSFGLSCNVAKRFLRTSFSGLSEREVRRVGGWMVGWLAGVGGRAWGVEMIENVCRRSKLIPVSRCDLSLHSTQPQ